MDRQESDSGPDTNSKASVRKRLACVNVPELPLQLMLRAHPEWVLHPAAVIADDKPHAQLLWVNERARQHGILPGHRYSAALTLCRDLQASTVTAELIQSGVDQLCTLLRRFSPNIEPASTEPGIFWVDASGLQRLYASLATWARSIERMLFEAGFTAVIVAGFSRFFTYAVARANRHSVICFRDVATETSAALTVALARLNIEPRVRDTLAKLGVHDVGAFIQLPDASLLERFGADLYALHQLASGHTWAPLQPIAETIPSVRRHLFDDAERDVYRLLFIIKRELDVLLRMLASKQQALLCVKLHCKLETPPDYAQTITPAEPTLDSRQILDLVRLRLEASPLASAATELEVEAVGTAATMEQLRMLAERVRRDLAAADRALARVRAELGPDAVTRAVLQDAHLPEASFRFERLDHTTFPHVTTTARPNAVRRLWLKPWALPTRAPQHPRVGPFVLTGGWWGTHMVRREYYFIEGNDGALHYCFYDVERNRWLVHGAL